MSPEQKTSMREAISHAETLDDLFRAFAVAYRVANALSDQDALAELTALKDERKALLEAHNDSAYGMVA